MGGLGVGARQARRLGPAPTYGPIACASARRTRPTPAPLGQAHARNPRRGAARLNQCLRACTSHFGPAQLRGAAPPCGAGQLPSFSARGLTAPPVPRHRPGLAGCAALPHARSPPLPRPSALPHSWLQSCGGGGGGPGARDAGHCTLTPLWAAPCACNQPPRAPHANRHAAAAHSAELAACYCLIGGSGPFLAAHLTAPGRGRGPCSPLLTLAAARETAQARAVALVTDTLFSPPWPAHAASGSRAVSSVGSWSRQAARKESGVGAGAESPGAWERWAA